MSFESRDLMIALLPTGKLNAFARPGLVLCGQVTAGGLDEDDEEEDDLECGQVTAGGDSSGYALREMDLALLRRQLRETLGDGPR